MDTRMQTTSRPTRTIRPRSPPCPSSWPGTIAVTAGLTGPVAHAEPRHDDADATHKRHVDEDRNVGHRSGVQHRPSPGRAQTVATTVAAASEAPRPPTPCSRATPSRASPARFGLSAQEVLVRNGLGWNTIIHPGQTLHLASTPAVATAARPPATAAPTGRLELPRQAGRHHLGHRGPRRRVDHGAARRERAVARERHLPGPDAPGAARPVRLRVPPRLPPRRGRPRSVRREGRVRHDQRPARPIASIAAAHGVSVSALLSANGLTYTSTIYAGKTLVAADVPAPRRRRRARRSPPSSARTPRRSSASGASLGVRDRGHRRRARRGDAGVEPPEPAPRRPRLGRPVPAAPEPGLGHRRAAAGPGARDEASSSADGPTRTRARPAACSTSPAGRR